MCSVLPCNEQVRAQYNVTVVAQDDGVPPLNTTATVTVTLEDVNEAPTVSAAIARSVVENTALGTRLATLGAADQDFNDTLVRRYVVLGTLFVGLRFCIAS